MDKLDSLSSKPTTMTQQELKQEALSRMVMLSTPAKAIDIYNSGKIPVTTLFGGLTDELHPIHKEALDSFRKHMPSAEVFYIVEYWEFFDVISILYVENELDEDDLEFERSCTKDGWPSIYGYMPAVKQGEFGSGRFFAENNTLYREA